MFCTAWASSSAGAQGCRQSVPLSGAAAGSQAPAATCPAPLARPRIGVALGGGGALGLAHVGVLRWMEEHHVPVDFIAGTSMGAVVGGLYASGQTPAQMRNLAVSDAFRSVFSLYTDYRSLNFERREDRREFPQGLETGLKGGVTIRAGLLTDEGLNALLSANFVRYHAAFDFDRMPIPFRAVATDLVEGKPVVLADCNLAEAVRASVSLPGAFSPVHENGHVYVDGGVSDNLPTDVVRRAGVDVVIAVSLPLSRFDVAEHQSAFDVLQRSFSVAVWQTELREREGADIVLEPQIQDFGGGDYGRADALILAGYQAAESMRARLLPLALSGEEWARYLAGRTARLAPLPGRIDQVRVEGGTAGEQKDTLHAMQSVEGKPLNPAQVEEKLNAVRGSGALRAYWTTLPPTAARAGSSMPAQTVDRAMMANPPAGQSSGLLIHLRPRTEGPPYLLVGSEVDAESGPGITRGLFQVRFLDQNLGGDGSELRAVARLGFLTDLSAEYIHRLTEGGGFIAPRVSLLRQPVYLWGFPGSGKDQQQTAEQFQQDAGGGLDLGWRWRQSSELRVGWQGTAERWHERLGSGGGPDLNGTAQLARARFVYEGEDQAVVPSGGWHLAAEGGYLFHAVDSANAPEVRGDAVWFHTFGDANTVSLGASGASYFGRSIAQPFLNTLGGPFRLSASEIDEYRGTDDFLIRPMYFRRIFTLPAPLGQGIYATAGYEAGRVWSPSFSTIERQDGIFGLVADTPLGAISLTGAVGDASHRKLVFTLGRLF